MEYVQKIAAIFSALQDHREGLGVSEMSRVTGIHKSTTSRLLAALRDVKFVETETDSNRFRVGPALIALAATAQPDVSLRQMARPFLIRLNAETKETATLSVLDGHEVLTIDEQSGPHSLRHVAWTGMRTPLNASASGKCILAFSQPDLFDSYLEDSRLEARTAQTIVDRDEFRKEIARTRERGYGYVSEELEDGVGALSVPIRDRLGRLLGVLNLSWPVFRVSQTDIDRFVSLLIVAGHDLSRVFGYQTSADD